MWKLLGILALVAIGGAALVGGGAWYWWTYHGAEYLDSGKTAMAEGAASGRVLDEAGCMIQAIERHKADWNRTMPSAIRNNLWLAACLDASLAREKFCDDVPSYENVVAAALWSASVCANHDLSDSFCGNLVSNAVKYCASPKRTEKLKPGAPSGPAFKS